MVQLTFMLTTTKENIKFFPNRIFFQFHTSKKCKENKELPATAARMEGSVLQSKLQAVKQRLESVRRETESMQVSMSGLKNKRAGLLGEERKLIEEISVVDAQCKEIGARIGEVKDVEVAHYERIAALQSRKRESLDSWSSNSASARHALVSSMRLLDGMVRRLQGKEEPGCRSTGRRSQQIAEELRARLSRAGDAFASLNAELEKACAESKACESDGTDEDRRLVEDELLALQRKNEELAAALPPSLRCAACGAGIREAYFAHGGSSPNNSE